MTLLKNSFLHDLKYLLEKSVATFFTLGVHLREFPQKTHTVYPKPNTTPESLNPKPGRLQTQNLKPSTPKMTSCENLFTAIPENKPEERLKEIEASFFSFQGSGSTMSWLKFRILGRGLLPELGR